ncbi:restriction endonuclease subunit S [Roseibacillus persicicus]|uniref:restriction endonuclease subunit S n=1 Tax=Roseibacillus persicicus TaxID=454148 RepID=UPI00280C6BC4|nr:restriction endonuclease subunit S [Roseibacillus persicicus]MDQ8192217.1 restriction endonuclease subunit S [Roseibacillus persicicus]
MKEGWEIDQIKDVCSLQNGFAFKSKDYSSSGARVIRITNVQNGYIADNTPRYIALSSLTNYKKFQINFDDILLSLTGDVGRVGRFPNHLLPALLNQRVCRIKNVDEARILKDFLFYFLDSHLFEDNAVATAKGAAQKNISTKSIGTFQIPIPPLSEQEEIVKVLDTAFAAIDQAKANIEQNIANAKELFQSKLNQIFSQKGEGWVETMLGRVDKLEAFQNQ